MFKRSGPRTLAVAVLSSALAASLAGCGDSSEDRRTELEQRRLSILRQFASAQASIRNAQADAMEAEAVAPAAERFNRLLRERILEIDPDAQPLLDRAREIGAEIDRLSQPVVLAPGEEPPTHEDRLAVAREFQRLEQAMGPLQAQAMADPEVQAAFDELQTQVHAEIVRASPQAESALLRMQALSAELEQIDAQIRNLGGGAR